MIVSSSGGGLTKLLPLNYFPDTNLMHKISLFT